MVETEEKTASQSKEHSDRGEEDVKRERGERRLCMGLCCARLLCSWSCKLIVLIVAINLIFLSGPLSKPLWIPISLHQACEQNGDAPPPAGPFGHEENMVHGGLQACEALCEQSDDCQAVDWYNNTRWCNLYRQPCLKPTASWDGASSYQIAVACTFFNGSAGVLIGGHCMGGIQLPTRWHVVKHEIPAMLASPRSWLCSLTVAVIYTYATSRWLQQKVPLPGGRRAACTRALLPVLGLACWGAISYRYWGISAFHELAEGKRPQLSLEEYIWYAASLALLIILLCPRSRGILLSGIASLGACLMSAFVNLAGCALSGCIDMTALAGTVAAAGGTAAAGAEAAVATEGAAAMEAGVAGEGVAGAATADTVAGSVTTAEATTAAEAAVAADAATLAEASAVAEGVGAGLLFCTVQ